jgi:hypothetical protein
MAGYALAAGRREQLRPWAQRCRGAAGCNAHGFKCNASSLYWRGHSHLEPLGSGFMVASPGFQPAGHTWGGGAGAQKG